MISRWDAGTVESLLDSVNRETALSVMESHFDKLAMFLERGSLLRPTGPDARHQLLEGWRSGQRSPASRLIHEYLSFRMPLLRPDALLERLLPLAAPLYTRGMLAFVLLVAVAGIFLVLRQWSQFQTTFLYFYSFEGLLYYLAVLAGTKVLHEFGHAMTAKRLGLRVPTMGIALLVLFPVLYTDTTQAWKLQSRKARFSIGAAGIVVELALAAFASVAWSFLDDGPLRSAMFLLATVTWVTTLSVNLNPLMRFDGYYLLSDALDIENLHDRSFELGKWWMRRTMFGLRTPAPEILTPKKTIFAICYAYLIWVYRFFLFIGIAVLVYQYAFKLLGAILMAFELFWFIGRPILRETKQWWILKEQMRFGINTVSSFAVFVGLIALLLVPWQGRIVAPAVLKTAREVTLFAPRAAQIESVHLKNWSAVTMGTPLVVLSVPELEHEITVTRTKISRLELLLTRYGITNELRERTLVLQRELAAARTHLSGLRADQRQLIVSVPFDALIVDVDTNLAKGSWINTSRPLARTVDPSRVVIEAYLSEHDVGRISVGTTGSFRSDLNDREIDSVTVLDVDRAGLSVLTSPYVASKFGGDVAVRDQADGRLLPSESVYRVLLSTNSTTEFSRRVERGTVYINAERKSFALGVWNKVLSVVIRESGF